MAVSLPGIAVCLVLFGCIAVLLDAARRAMEIKYFALSVAIVVLAFGLFFMALDIGLYAFGGGA